MSPICQPVLLSSMPWRSCSLAAAPQSCTTWAGTAISPGEGKPLLSLAGHLWCVDYLRIIFLAVGANEAGNGFCGWLNAEKMWQLLSVAMSCKYLTRKKNVTKRFSLSLGSEGWWKWDVALRTAVWNKKVVKRGGQHGSWDAIDRNWCVTLNGSFSVSTLVYLSIQRWDLTSWSPESLSALRFCDFMNFPGKQRHSYLGCLCSNSQGHISSGLYSRDSNYFLLAENNFSKQ